MRLVLLRLIKILLTCLEKSCVLDPEICCQEEND